MTIRIAKTHMKTITEKEAAALEVLKSTGSDVLEAALVAKEALGQCRGRVGRVRKCLALGREELRARERTVSFAHAVEAALEEREAKGLRRRSIIDFRYLCRRLMRCNEGLAQRRVRGIKPVDCEAWLRAAFDTPQQFRKARAVLSGVFSTARRRGWCGENPVAAVALPRVREQPVGILRREEIDTLLNTAATYDGGSCRAAVALMLYAGIRPGEVARLTWASLDTRHGSISILPQHSKTGGARRVEMSPALLRLLRSLPDRPSDSPVCPSDWLRRWSDLRRAAGWHPSTRPWPQDILRHTFATYHLHRFRDYSRLQWAMGHRDSTLLRTRYIDERDISAPDLLWA